MSKDRSLHDALRFIRGNNLVFALTDLPGNSARGMVMPYASLYILALGGDTTQIGLVNSIRPLAGLVMFPVGGYIADHARRVRLVVLGSCLSAAIVLMYTLAPSWGCWPWRRCCRALSSSSYLPGRRSSPTRCSRRTAAGYRRAEHHLLGPDYLCALHRGRRRRELWLGD
jgi:MFS family permease